MNLFSKAEELDEVCFLCGQYFDKQEKNQEHIFPKWILNKYKDKFHVKGYVGGDNHKKTTDFWRQKLLVHKDCNDRFGTNLETKICSGKFSDVELWAWTMKIVAGLLFHEAKYSEKRPDFYPYVLTGRNDDDLVRFWEEQASIFEYGCAEHFTPFTVFELDYLFSEDLFYHTARFDLGVFWVCFNQKSFLVFYNLQLSDEELKFAQSVWEEAQNWDYSITQDVPMFKYNFYTAKMAIEMFFARRSQVWNPGMVRLEFDRPERTQELEIELYSEFGFELSFKEDGTVKVLMPPNSLK